MISYICFLLDQLRDLRVDPRLLQEVLDLLLLSFEKAVQCLRLKNSNYSSEGLEPNRSRIEESRYPLPLPVHLPSHLSAIDEQDLGAADEDDIRWFFTDDETTPTSYSLNISEPQLDRGSLTPMPIPTSINGNNTFEKINIWKGLEHCLHWDFEFSCQNRHDGRDEGVSLPMKIALAAATHILGQDVSNVDNINVRSSLASQIPLSNSMSFEWIQGRSIADTVVCENTVIEFCESVVAKKNKAGKGGFQEAPHVAAQGSRVYASYQQAVERRGGEEGLQQVAVVDLAVRTEDKSTAQLRVSGSGGSQQADALQQQVLHVHLTSTPEEAFATIQHLNSIDCYIDRALAHLLELNVQILLCPYSVPLKLLDACYENGICVVPMSTDNLHIMAKLTAADVMEDILDLYPECLGCNGTHPGCVQITTQDCVRRVQGEDPDSMYKAQLSVMLLLHVSGNETFSAGGRNDVDNEDIDSYRTFSSPSFSSFSSNLTPFRPYANSSSDALQHHKHGKRHSTVLITCPTAVMGCIIEDRIRKCISRIGLVLQEAPLPVNTTHLLTGHENSSSGKADILAPLIPGGGVVELLCAKYVQTFKKNNTSDSSSAVMYADKLVQSMQDFVNTVNTNNGQTPGFALSRWNTCMQDLSSKFTQAQADASVRKNTTYDGSAANRLVEFVASLDTIQLLCLPRPIVVGDEDQNQKQGSVVVLDLASLKLETMRVACFAVKSILGASHIISLS